MLSDLSPFTTHTLNVTQTDNEKDKEKDKTVKICSCKNKNDANLNEFTRWKEPLEKGCQEMLPKV